MPAWLLLCLALTTGTSAGAAPLVEVPSFGSNPGNLRMFVLVPDNLPPDAALVVVAHGCRIWVESGPDGGCVVAFEIPREEVAP